MKRLLPILVLLVAATPARAATPQEGVVANVTQGKSLYAANCSRCHGSRGQGLRDQGPSLKDAGALAADFYVRTGYMPLDNPHSQPWRTRVLFTEQEIRSLVAYVATIGHGPAIPSPQWQTASVAAGRQLFADHCAGCHQIAIAGGVLPGARIPPLNQPTPRQIAEAVRVGPYLMPKFSTKAITPTQLNDLVAYVQYAKRPDDRGGWAIGHLGPWPEGMVTWLLAASILVATCLLIGRRLKA
ncbi:MAG: c-type cytochrome [Actinomycetia bacterium]|jgi:ubiquinol-cytochrome c reductase cytochrome c subunit|nr:c-type cytochrome [Actinomycetes bacterium]